MWENLKDENNSAAFDMIIQKNLHTLPKKVRIISLKPKTDINEKDTIIIREIRSASHIKEIKRVETADTVENAPK